MSKRDCPAPQQTAHIVTPLLHSAPLSALASERCKSAVRVYLKMDALQPSGSFKVRGLGNTIDKAAARAEAAKDSGNPSSSSSSSHGPLSIISSSGGNAGLAAAYCARMRNLPCYIFVPSSTEAFVVDLMRAEGADVTVGGDAWDECDIAAKSFQKQIQERGQRALYVHPFLGEDTIDGHASIVHEVRKQLIEAGESSPDPDAIICSAGGAGLARGVMRPYLQQGLDKAQRPQILVTQCFGADSFGQSIVEARAKGQTSDDAHVQPITLPAITSKATSMGAKTCAVEAIREALAYGTRLSSVVVQDALAEKAAWQFARDHRILVELACSAALTPVYCAERLLVPFVESKGHLRDDARLEQSKGPFVVVVVVCGGNKISAEMLEQWRQKEQESHVRATINGREV